MVFVLVLSNIKALPGSCLEVGRDIIQKSVTISLFMKNSNHKKNLKTKHHHTTLPTTNRPFPPLTLHLTPDKKDKLQMTSIDISHLGKKYLCHKQKIISNVKRTDVLAF